MRWISSNIRNSGLEDGCGHYSKKPIGLKNGKAAVAINLSCKQWRVGSYAVRAQVVLTSRSCRADGRGSLRNYFHKEKPSHVDAVIGVLFSLFVLRTSFLSALFCLVTQIKYGRLSMDT